MTAWNSIIDKYYLKLETDAPLHVGSAAGERSDLLVHPVTDMPFLQASGLAGVLRSASELINGGEETDRLFGAAITGEDDTLSNAGSRIRISDGEFVPETIRLESRPRVAIDPVSGSVGSSTISGSGKSSGHKFEMELIGAGAVLSFTIYLMHGEKDQDREALEAVLSELAAGHLQAGGQKSNGAGFLILRKLLHKRFFLSRESDRSAWYQEHKMEESDYEDLTEKLILSDHSAKAYDIVITGKTEGALLVKAASVAEYGPGAPDAENMKNASGQYIIPGSSLKGALRSQVSLIAKRLNKPALVKAMFGSGGEKDRCGKRGNVISLDTVIGKDARKVFTKLQHRIHIDQFTGGVMQTGLFAERTVSGDLALHIVVDDFGDPEASVGMILLAVRDLAEGLWNLGSGFNVGRGFICVDKMLIRPLLTEGQTELEFTDGKVVDPENRLQTYLQAVAKWEEQ